MNKNQAESIAGKLSKTSKMPCDSYGIPMQACITGAKLAKIEGTVCNICYADTGAYKWSNVKPAYANRLTLWNTSDREEWKAAMKYLINSQCERRGTKFFRWFDSGDLQSLEMLETIMTIAYEMPEVKFWLPTREKKFIIQYLEKWGEQIPENICVRISENFIDKMPVLTIFPDCIKGSAVADKELQITCPSSQQHGSCDDCRKCWSREIEIVTYKRH